MNTRKTGALVWIAALLSFVPQIIAASRWPQAYSFGGNLISDLGVTTCGTFDEGSNVERYICSPWHDLANAGTVANGVLFTLGAVLLWNSWPRAATGRIAMVLIGIGGLLLIGVGYFPWDTHPAEHTLTALLQALFQWAGMVFLLISTRKSEGSRGIRGVTALALAISVIGFVLFAVAIGGGSSLGLGVGALERVALDSLTIWAAVVGVLLLQDREHPVSTAR